MYDYLVDFITADGRPGRYTIAATTPITNQDVLDEIECYISEQIGEQVTITDWRRWEEAE